MPSTAFRTPPLVYVECDLADGQTLTEWRRARHAPPAPRRRLHRALDRLTPRPPGRHRR